MKLKHKFAKAIYYARSEQKLTQATVAERADVSVRGYQRLEKGEYEPQLSTALRLMIVLQINPNEFAEEVGVDVPVSSSSQTVQV